MISNKKIERWSIFIDVEGFSFLHKTSEFEAHRRLNNLIEDIYKIGRMHITISQIGNTIDPGGKYS